MDVLGPWIVQARGNPCEFSALTAIDTVTNLVEIIRVDDKNLETLKLYLINYPYLLIMGRQCFVFLFHGGTEQSHQGNKNNIMSFLIHPKRYAIRTDLSRLTDAFILV